MQLTRNIDKLGIAGLFITAIFSPCCFPLFAFAASALGLGSFELFGGWSMYVFMAMVLISIAGLIISYRKHHCLYPLLIAVPAAVLIFYGFYSLSISPWMYIGMFGMLLATLVNYHRNRLHGNCDTCAQYNGKIVELESVITCPHCNHKKTEMMPVDSCQYFYECQNCKKILKPLEGDCCVYCSYGTVKCPPIQSGDKCC